MRLLVTGSEGSLMQWTIRHLLDQGHEVVGVDNYARYDDYEHTKVVDEDEYQFHKVDLTDTGDTMMLFDTHDFDAVINAAAMIWGVKGFHEHPATILSNDLMVDRNTLEAAHEHGVERTVNISSSMVYERTDPPHDEDDVWDGPFHSTDYGLSKAVGERYHMAFWEEYNMPYTVWRPFNIITPFELSEDEDGMSHVFADFMQKLLIDNQNPMDILGSGEQVRCFTWIDDIAEAIATHSFSDETENEAFNLVNREPVTMKELARRIHRKGVERGIREDQPLQFNHKEIYDDDVDKRIASDEKAKEAFGWEPSVQLDDALEKCIDETMERREEV